MSAWLVPFLTGLVKGFAAEFSRSEPAGGTSAGYDFRQPAANYGAGARGVLPHGYDFRQHMVALARGSDTQLKRLTHVAACFDFTFRGVGYSVVALLFGHEIEVSAWSNMVFPAGRAPLELAQSWDPAFHLVDDREADVIRLSVMGNVEDLTVVAFRQLLAELVPRVIALDIALRESGCTP